MKYVWFPAAALALTLMLWSSAGLCQTKAPKTIADLTLGKNISDYKDRLDMTTDGPLWNEPYISRVKVNPTKGYRSGYISYGNCAHPGQILRIKMNYDSTELNFFEGLVRRIAEKYGKPVEWKGNMSGTLKGFKWSVPAENGEDVSLTATIYYGEFDDITQGNSIRLAINKFRDEEKACWEKKNSGHKKPAPYPPGEINNDWFMPH